MADDKPEDAGLAPESGRAKRTPPTIDLEATEVSTQSQPTAAAEPEVQPTPEQATPTPVACPTGKDDRQPKPTEQPTAPPKKPAFSMLNNTSYSGGSRITYYPRASVGQCEADCAANASCRAFTWIRPGAYNPGDSAMCYLMYSVSGPVSHPCCISGVKN